MCIRDRLCRLHRKPGGMVLCLFLLDVHFLLQGRIGKALRQFQNLNVFIQPVGGILAPFCQQDVYKRQMTQFAAFRILDVER